ncbi:MAG: hypothetical protein WBP60_10240 [Gammaproteobacteria bacterium]
MFQETLFQCEPGAIPGRGRASRAAFAAAGALVLAAVLSACGGGGDGAGPVAPDPVVDAPDESNDRIAITNNQAALDVRVLYPEQPVPVDVSVVAQKSGSVLARKPSVTLTLASEIFPPTVDGQVVQATSVSQRVSGNAAMVSYNMRGAPRLGAVDWVTQTNSNRPLLSSGATFNDADINAVSADAGNVYMAMATDAPDFAFPAVLERLRVNGNRLTLDGNERVGLASFAATSALAVGDTVYATSGDTGGLFALAENNLSQIGEFALHDARWVAVDVEGGRVVVAQGTPGQISVFAEGEFPAGSMNLLNSFPFPGADIPESKSTVEIVGGKAFVAAGPEGVQVVCLDNGEIIGNVPRPDPAALGLDPSVVVTNAVTVDKDLMFISNGEAGVYVAKAKKQFQNSGCAQQEITVEGQLRFDDLQSANHVSFKGNYLFVAAGLGGVKVVRVKGN